MVWRFELVGLYHKFVADVDGGGFVGGECIVVVNDGVDGSGISEGDELRCRRMDCC